MSKSETDRIVQEAVRTAQRRGVRMALTGYLVFFGGIVAERYISSGENRGARQTIVKSGTAVAVSACNERFRDRRSIRAVLIASRLQVRQRDDISSDRRRRAINFLNDRLARLPMPDCRESLTVLSAKPNAEVRIPKPLYLEPAPKNQQENRDDEERDERDASGG